MSDYVSKLQDYLREKRIDGEIIEVRKASTWGMNFIFSIFPLLILQKRARLQK